MDRSELIQREVRHQELGDGTIVSVFENGNIRVDFHGKLKAFIVPDAFQRGTLKTSDALVQKYVADRAKEKQIHPEKQPSEEPVKEPCIFCNIMWAENYDDPNSGGVNGGSYVDKTGSGNENMNFLPVEVTVEGRTSIQMLGSFETKTTGGSQNKTHIENISGCDAMRYNDFVSGVTVIWCATPPQGGCRVVGWYKNATVYRNYQTLPIDESDGSSWDRWYNIKCDVKDAVLLPVEERMNSDKWQVPRKPHDLIGFYKANIWYASEDEARGYVRQMLRKIDEYTQKQNALQRG